MARKRSAPMSPAGAVFIGSFPNRALDHRQRIFAGADLSSASFQTAAARVFITGNSSLGGYLACGKTIAAALKTPGDSGLKIVIYEHSVACVPPRITC